MCGHSIVVGVDSSFCCCNDMCTDNWRGRLLCVFKQKHMTGWRTIGEIDSLHRNTHKRIQIVTKTAMTVRLLKIALRILIVFSSFIIVKAIGNASFPLRGFFYSVQHAVPSVRHIICDCYLCEMDPSNRPLFRNATRLAMRSTSAPNSGGILL